MIRVVDLGSGSWIFTYPSWIPDPGVKKAPDPGTGSATLSVNPPVVVKDNFFKSGVCKPACRRQRDKAAALLDTYSFIKFSLSDLVYLDQFLAEMVETLTHER